MYWNICSQSSLSDTPLWGACRGGNIDTIKVLLDHGGNVDSQNKVHAELT